MTNQEAIDTIKTAIAEVEWEYPMDYAAAFDMAIEALAKDNNVPTKWVGVKDDLPKEHPSMFAAFYGTDKWNRAMWRTESDRVLVTIQFPDGTRTVDKGKLQDGEWRTGVSPALRQEVTHWAVWPEPPKEET